MEQFIFCPSCYRLVGGKETEVDGFWAITLDDPQHSGSSRAYPVCPECGKKLAAEFKEIMAKGIKLGEDES